MAVLSAVLRCARADGGVLVLHSSLIDLRPPDGVGKWDFLWVLRQLVDRGHTLALPAFTFSFCRSGEYRHDLASETGQLADWALELPEFRRTRHPIYSFAVAGPQAAELERCANSTTFGDDSIFARFEELDARVVMLGAGWPSCTQFHRSEELEAVPYRLFKDFAGSADFGSGAGPVRARMFVRDLDLGASNDFTPLIEALRAEAEVVGAPLWAGRVEAADARAITRVGRRLLGRDPWALVSEGRRCERRGLWRAAAAKAPPLKVAMVGSATLDLLAGALERQLTDLLQDRRIAVYATPFGRALGEMVDPAGGLAAFGADVTFFVDRLEDLLGRHSLVGVDKAIVLERAEQYCQAIKLHRGRAGGWFVVHRFVTLPSGPFDGAQGVQGLVAEANALLDQRLGEVANLRLMAVEPLAAAGGVAMTDDRLWFIGRFPYSDGFSALLARHHAGHVLAATGRTARLVVVDLDNTLWGGVLGEDGQAGLRLGGDYPGNAFAAFQAELRALTRTGIALAVCSKNDAQPALEAMASLPDMALRPDAFVAHRIDWQPKWANLADICRELDLGPDSVLFIDDNPAEREQMRRNLPQVRVLDLPDDPALYVQALRSTPWLQRLELTAEDIRRVDSYRARAEINDLRGKSEDSEAFHASLHPRLHCRPLSDGTLARAVQLLQKTNQFNVTTRRHDAQALARMAEAGCHVIVLGLEDRFSPFENVGLLIVDWARPGGGWAEIDTYLLSCRVLGRGLEVNALRWLAGHARRHGAKGLVGRVVETERNTPARGVFRDAGFAAGPEPGEWRLELDGADVPLPAWLDVVDGFGE